MHATQRTAALLALAVGFGCGADYAGGDFGSPDSGTGLPECLSSNECPTGHTCTEFGVCVPPSPGADAGLPPEAEVEFSRPTASRRYVYVAMTELDALARIDGNTLAVTSVSVGAAPKVLATVPGADSAVVLDTVNSSATIVRPTQSADEKTTVATLKHLNRLDIDPTGRYAIGWFDLNQAILDAGGLDFVGDVGSFQGATLIRLPPAQVTSVELTVGFRPRAVRFDAAGTRAFLITQTGISVIDLAAASSGGPAAFPPIGVGGDPFGEVHVAASGDHAVARDGGLAELRIIELAGEDAGRIHHVPLPGVPTDLDLSPDGARAYAVLRDEAALAVVEVPGAAFDPGAVEVVDLGEEQVGSLVLSPDGARGLLFTNATPVNRVTVIELGEPGTPRASYPLSKAVRSAAIAPSGDHALVIHAKQPGDPGSAPTFDEFIARSYGYSVLDLATGFARLEITPVDPGPFTFADDAPLAYLLLDGGDAEGAVARTHIIRLAAGSVREVVHLSPPDAVGILPDAAAAFVSQRHPLGRVTFFAVPGGEQRTVTGFDLNSRIID